MPVGGWSDRVAPALRQVHAVLGPQRRSRLRRRHRLLLLLGLQQELHLPVERVLALDLLRLREIATWLVEADWEARCLSGGLVMRSSGDTSGESLPSYHIRDEQRSATPGPRAARVLALGLRSVHVTRIFVGRNLASLPSHHVSFLVLFRLVSKRSFGSC